MGGAALPRYADYANVSLPMFNQLYAPSGRVGAGGPVPIAPPSTQSNPFEQGYVDPNILQYLSPGFERPPTQYTPAAPGVGASPGALGGAAAPAPIPLSSAPPPTLTNAQRKQRALADPANIGPFGWGEDDGGQ
jgi:hypothetical protein